MPVQIYHTRQPYNPVKYLSEQLSNIRVEPRYIYTHTHTRINEVTGEENNRFNWETRENWK